MSYSYFVAQHLLISFLQEPTCLVYTYALGSHANDCNTL
jgi:hypothetical protein